jgi:hypothetical protein
MSRRKRKAMTAIANLKGGSEKAPSKRPKVDRGPGLKNPDKENVCFAPN